MNRKLIVGIILALIIGITLGSIRPKTKTAESKSDGMNVRTLEIPRDFGAPISIGGTDYGRMLILFENGALCVSATYGVRYRFVYVDDS